MNLSNYPTCPVLVVDDDPISVTITSATLCKCGLNNVLTCTDSQQVMDLVSQHQIRIVLLDLVMPYVSGEELLQSLSENYPEVLVIILTATEEVDTAVRCIKAGAFNYLTKPIILSGFSPLSKTRWRFGSSGRKIWRSSKASFLLI